MVCSRHLPSGEQVQKGKKKRKRRKEGELRGRALARPSLLDLSEGYCAGPNVLRGAAGRARRSGGGGTRFDGTGGVIALQVVVDPDFRASNVLPIYGHTSS